MATTHLHDNAKAVMYATKSTGLWALMSEAAHEPLLGHAPNGAAWPREEGSWVRDLLKIAAYSFSRIYRRAEDLRREFSPRLARETLPEWEKDWGVAPEGAVAARQTAVVTKIKGLGPRPSAVPTLLELALGAGYVGTTIKRYTITEAGDPIALPLFDEAWRFRVDLVLYAFEGNYTALKNALAIRTQAHGVLGILDAWRQWVGLSMPTSFTVNGGFAIKGLGGALPGVCLVGSAANVWFSSDGRIWTQVTTGAGFVGAFTAGCQRNDGLVVLVGTNEIQHKALSASVFSRIGAGGVHTCVATDGVNCVIGTDGGDFYHSVDGINWSFANAGSGYSGQFGCVAWNAPRALWIAGGSVGEIQTSPDRVNWTRIANGGAANYIAITVLPSGETILVTQATSSYVRVSPTGVVTGAFTVPGITDIKDIKMSADGGCLIAVGVTSGAFVVAISRDSGATWVVRNDDNATASVKRLVIGPPDAPFAIATNDQPYFRGRYDGIENAV